MNLETLKELLIPAKREYVYKKILETLREAGKLDHIQYEEFETIEGNFPVITIPNNYDTNKIRSVKLFLAAQHNEYSGLFAILEFFEDLLNNNLKIEDLVSGSQVYLFLPLVNLYGFLNPEVINKSGYFLRNGANLNRYWRRTLAPDFINDEEDLNSMPFPEETMIVKNLLHKFLNSKDIAIYILDIHETSLLKRFMADLAHNLKKESITYKFDHWLKEGIILNIMKLYNIKSNFNPLFYNCNKSADHNHIRLSVKQIDTVHAKLLDYIVKNQDRMPFYFCYSDKAEAYCHTLANKVYSKLKDKLWETSFPSFNHHFHDHGCFVRMSDATKHNKVYAMELESHKHFFNLFDEIKKSENRHNYFVTKLNDINISIELALETIKTMIKLD